MTLETDMRRAHRQILNSQRAMMSAKTELLEHIRQARSEDYSLGDIARVLGVTRGQAQKYANQAREEDG